VEKQYDVFLAFGGVDREVVTAVAGYLRDFKWRVFVDDDVLPGVRWDQAIERAGTEARALVYLAPRDGAASPYVAHEVQSAVQQATRGGIRFLPFYVEGGSPGYGELPFKPGRWFDNDARKTAVTVDAMLQRAFADAPERSGGRPAARAAPLPEASVHLDRIHAWMDLHERMASDFHEVFLIRGDEDQYLGDFLERVRTSLPDKVRCPLATHIIPTHREKGTSMTVTTWRARFHSVVGGSSLSEGLAMAGEHERPVLLVGDQPLSPASSDASRRKDLEALASFLGKPSGGLGAQIRSAQPKHPVRVVVAIEEAADGAVTALFRDALRSCAEAMGIRFMDTPEITFPPYADVERYVQQHHFQPDAAWWTSVRAEYDRIKGSGDFMKLARMIDKKVREIPRAAAVRR
jgi:hypothetical protein